MVENYRAHRTDTVVRAHPVMGRLISRNNQTPAFLRVPVYEKHRALLVRDGSDTH